MTRLLVDTNLFLEVILDQERADEARTLLSMTQEHDLFITDYSLHSIGLLLFRRGRHDVFRQFVKDMMLNAGTTTVSLAARDMEAVADSAVQFSLDFDDAYQYVAAEKHDLTLVSLDGDFDRTERGRRTPLEVIQD